MNFSISKRMIVDNKTVARLDDLASQSCEEDLRFGGLTRNAQNARRRYLRLVQRVTGKRYPTHTYTGSGQQIVPKHTEVYFGHGT